MLRVFNRFFLRNLIFLSRKVIAMTVSMIQVKTRSKSKKKTKKKFGQATKLT